MADSTDFSQLGGPAADGAAPRQSFWNRPEGVAGALLIIALGALMLANLNPVLEFLIRLMQNTISLIVTGVVLAGLVFLLTSRDIRTGLFFLFKTLSRNLAGIVVKLDPIAIMKIYVDDLKQKRTQMNGQIDRLQGQLVKLNRTITDNNDQIKQKFAEANKANSIADRPGMQDAARLATIEGAGLQEMNQKLLPLQQNIQTVLAFMEKVNQSADYIIKETEIKVRLKETEYKIVRESSNALRTAVSIFKGNPDKKFYFDQSMEYIQDDMSQKLGEMKRAMDLSMDFINGVDIQNGIMTDKGQALLDAYNRGDFKLAQLSAPGQNPITAPVPGQANPPRDAGYRSLLD
jgi:hypothetical protein